MPGLARWLPASLFGRLMLVLGLGLLLAQLLSAAINVAERDRLVLGSFGVQPAQRIADVVLLLDDLGPAERQRFVAVFGVPPLVLSLHDAPAIAADTAGDWRAHMFADASALGAGRRPGLARAAARELRRQGPAPPARCASMCRCTAAGRA